MIEGEVERVEPSSIRGWAASQEDRDDFLLIEAFVRGRLRGSTSADRDTPLAPAGVNGGQHGFVIEFARPLSAPELAELQIFATAASGERAPIRPGRANGDAAPANGADDDPLPPVATALSPVPPSAADGAVDDRRRAFLHSLGEARGGFEAALHDLAAAAARQETDAMRRAAAEQEAELLRTRLGSARQALDAAEDVIRYMAAGLRELGAVAAADKDPAGAAAPVFSPAEADPDEAAPEFPESWLPDPLREYIIDRFGDGAVAFVRETMAIINRHDDDRAGFADSYDCRALLRRLRAAAPAPETGEAVDVSIVIPVHNALVFTLTCLHSLFAMPTRYRFEIIVADDASNDGTGEVVPAIGGRVRYLGHAENLGFLLNCNISAHAARGRWIVLLNNDVIVLPGWLDELIDTFGRDARIGYVGSKLLNADGSLQEAGGIFWSDGSAWNFGRGRNPRLPEFNYLKEADYCSGAAIALPKAVWERLGGFDLRYVPAYCEEADLAFRVREAGLTVLYQPFAEIIHHEGKSHGRDTARGIKAYQVVNGGRLYERWGAELRARHFPNGEQLFLARDRSRGRPHILFADHYVPQWDRDAGSRTIYAFLRFFAHRGFQISFWPENLYQDPIYTKPLQQLGIEVVYSSHYVGKFAQWMQENGKSIDYVLLSRANVAVNYVDATRMYSTARILYYGHDLPWRRLTQEYMLTRDAAKMTEAEAAQHLEDAVCRAVDVALYPTDEECELARERLPQCEIAAIPAYTYDAAQLAAARDGLHRKVRRERHHLLFVGGFAHPPNADAVTWFVTEVLPLVKSRNARFHLTVVGSNPPPEIVGLHGRSVTVTGQLDDAALAELYRKVGAAIVPLRAGAGIKGKVIEAFAMGTPLVSTTVGTQGIADADRLALVADDARGFADCIIEAVSNPEAAAARARAAIDFVERHYSEEAILDALRRYMPALADL
jgi:GT2 family glycosyltransferase/glycosyltransferase involved in cell wall biosynthesis